MLQNTTVLLGAGGGPLTWVAVDVSSPATCRGTGAGALER